jgi:hypothetical protein
MLSPEVVAIAVSQQRAGCLLRFRLPHPDYENVIGHDDEDDLKQAGIDTGQLQKFEDDDEPQLVALVYQKGVHGQHSYHHHCSSCRSVSSSEFVR